LFGVGLGDFQNLLNKEYTSSGMYIGNPKLNDTGYLGYGPHNQYIEMFFSLGFCGLLLFLFLLFRQVFIAFQSLNTLYVLFILLNILFFVTESALSTNKGIIFYVLFSMLFNCLYNKNKLELIH
jgi:O-antigen ligase